MPIPILMAVPLGIIGAVLATALRGWSATSTSRSAC